MKKQILYILIVFLVLFLGLTPFILTGIRKDQVSAVIPKVASNPKVSDLTGQDILAFLSQHSRTVLIFESQESPDLIQKVNHFLGKEANLSGISKRLHVYQVVYPSQFLDQIDLPKDKIRVGIFSYDKLVGHYDITHETSLSTDFIQKTNQLIEAN